MYLLLTRSRLILLMLIGIIIACGSVHQMIPPAPLGPGKFRASTALSFDFARFSAAPSFGMNFYWGIGKQYNLGFGYQPLVSIPHFTAAKYFRNKDEYKYMLHSSIYNVTPSEWGYALPNIEIGGSWISSDDNFRNVFSTGLWFYVDNYQSILPFGNSCSLSKSAQNKPHARLFFRYNFLRKGNMAGIQLYPGLTRRALISDMNSVELDPPVLIPYSQIDTIIPDFYAPYEIIIKLNDNTEYHIYKKFPYFEWSLWPCELTRMHLLKFGAADSTKWHLVFINFSDLGMRICNIDLDKIRSKYQNHQDIILGDKIADRQSLLQNIHWYKNDWSVSAGWGWK
jgi:hypothetical protein